MTENTLYDFEIDCSKYHKSDVKVVTHVYDIRDALDTSAYKKRNVVSMTFYNVPNTTTYDDGSVVTHHYSKEVMKVITNGTEKI